MVLSYMVLNLFKESAKMSLELVGVLLELLLELLLLLLYAFYHVLIRGREAPPYNYVINAYSRSSISSSWSSSSSSSIWIRPGEQIFDFPGTLRTQAYFTASP